MAGETEIAVVLRLIASQFQSELRKSHGALGDFGNLLRDYRVQLAATSAALLAIAKGTANYGEELVKTSQKTGLQIEALQGLKHAADLADVSNEQFTTGLAQLSKHLVETGQGGRDMRTVLLELSDRFRSMPDGPEKTALAMQRMGKAGQQLIPLLNTDLRAAQEELERMGGVMSTEAAQAAADFNDNLKRLETSLKIIRNNIGNELIPVLNFFVESYLKGMEKIRAMSPKGGGLLSLFAEAAASLGFGGAALGVGMSEAGKDTRSVAELTRGAGGTPELGPNQERLGEAIVAYTKIQNRLREAAAAARAAAQERLGAGIVSTTTIEERLRLEAEAAAGASQERLGAGIVSTTSIEVREAERRDAVLKKFYEEEEQAFIKSRLHQVVAESRATEELQRLNEQYVEQYAREHETLFESLNRGLQDYVKNHEQSFNLATDVVRQSANAMQSGLKQLFLDPAKMGLTDLLNIVHNVFADIAARLVTAGVTTGLAGFFNTGPNQGAQLAAARGSANPALFGPGFASGGSFVVGGDGGMDTTPIGFWATRGERVTVTPQGQGQGGVVVNVINQAAGVQAQPQSRTGPGGESIVDIVIRQVDQAISGGSFDRSLATNFGLRRQGFAR